MTIREEYAAKHQRSAMLHARGERALPSGVNHDARYMSAFQLYVQRAEGVYKWDVDGNRLLDYVMGHGALLLGHGHPAVVHALEEQVRAGTHYGACSELELDWAEKVVQLVPSAQEVRFTMSGTEATLLAMRLARGFTGRRRIVKFEGHFHGWHDYALIGDRPPFDRLPQGVPDNLREDVIVLPTELAAVRQAVERPSDVAAVIVEASGASWATVGLPEGFLSGLRQLCDQHGALLIFDEVVSGFRWSTGGIQQLAGVLPDLTTLAKILAGGLPGGAVAGRREIMELISFHDGARKIIHQGTFNANPLSAAAGCACLSVVQDPGIQRQADARAADLRRGLNEVLTRLGVPGCAYGESSVFHTILGVECPEAHAGDVRQPALPAASLKAGSAPAIAQNLDMAMINRGVHLFRGGGFVSAIAEPEHIAATVEAFEGALNALRAEALL